jgi:hypothetical protein
MKALEGEMAVQKYNMAEKASWDRLKSDKKYC